MNKFYDNILPCLHSVGPWWTELDRRILFSHLLKIFPFDAEYLSTLPAAVYVEYGDTHRLTQSTIKEDLHSLNKEDIKVTCPCIRKLDFSFGKLNPRVCYLCSYSGTYKNNTQLDEYRFLYHIMNHEARTLSSYLNNNKKNCKDIFKSFFPVYANDILIEVYPFELIAKQFLTIPAGAFISDSLKYHEQILEGLKEELVNRFKYHRMRTLIEKHIPNYQSLLLDSTNQILFSLENQNKQTRSINESLMKRLFALLLKPSKFSAKDPKQYICKDYVPSSPNIFESTIIKNTANFSSPEKSVAKTQEIIKLKKTELVNPLSCLEDESFQELPDLDAKNMQLNSLKEPICEFSGATTFATPLPSKTKANPYDIIHTQAKTQPSTFNTFYSSKTIETFYICGEQHFQYDKAILDAFFDNTSFLAMEPFIINDRKGILMCNANIDKVFYPIELLGPKEIRYIDNQKIPVYTSNVYQLASYLFSNKIYKLELHDVGAATSLLGNKAIHCISDFCKTALPDCMDIYFDIYQNAIANLSEARKTMLNRLEQFLPLLCGDGLKVPFASMQQLVNIINATTYKFLYTSDKQPERTGMFLQFQVKIDEHLKFSIPSQHLYMDVCIELNKYVPFFNGAIQLLQINDNGLLLYLIGNYQEIQKNQLYAAACIRRIFSSLLEHNFTISIEEKSHLFNKN